MERRPLLLKRVAQFAVLLAGIAAFGLPQTLPAAAQGQYIVKPVAR